MTPGVDAALSAPNALIAGLLKIVLPDYTLLLCDGSAEVLFEGETYLGEDPEFGVWAGAEALDEAVGDQAPAISITLLPPSLASAIGLSHPSMQGAVVSMWMAVVVMASGEVVPDPVPIFNGEIDVTTLQADRGQRSLVIECVSSMERLFDNEEGMRLSPAFHKSIWPEELGMDNITGTPINDIWGPGDRPAQPRIVRDPPPSGVRANF